MNEEFQEYLLTIVNAREKTIISCKKMELYVSKKLADLFKTSKIISRIYNRINNDTKRSCGRSQYLLGKTRISKTPQIRIFNENSENEELEILKSKVKSFKIELQQREDKARLREKNG